MDAGNVTGRGDDATLTAADDHGLVGELRIVALLDRGIEGIAVDMREGQPVEFGVPEEPRTAAGEAPP